MQELNSTIRQSSKPIEYSHRNLAPRIVSLAMPLITLAILASAAIMSSIVASEPAYGADNKNNPIAEKSLIEKSDKLAPAQAHVINKVPGVKVKTEDLKQEPLEKGPGLNPVAWVFSPVTKLQKQSVRLEQQIMKLTGPIASLQPAMLGLDTRMSSVHDEMAKVQSRMVSVQGDMGKVREQLGGMQSDISAMRDQMSHLEKPMQDLKEPISRLQGPLLKLEKPVSSVGTRLDSVEKQLGELKGLIALVLSSIYLAAILIAVGTPVAAILVWRNRRKILPDEPHERELNRKIDQKIRAR